MKDTADTKTIDILTAPRRGRPSSGKALTSAQRKQAQRDRDRKKIWTTTLTDLSECTTTGLLEQLAQAVKDGAPAIAKFLCDELIQRATDNAD